ncbi:MAG: hypothetical protein WC341_04280 [Bacteroidales bacterium]|jgi:hypothetical protein
MKKVAIALFFIILLIVGNFGCSKNNVNPNIPKVVINFTLDPNSTVFQELNTVGGWLYLDEVPGWVIPSASRGIIIYRMELNTFKAYERQPPNDPYKCCDDQMQNCSKLIVGKYYPFAADTCTNNMYSMYDGSLFQGEGRYPMIEYYAEYDGGLLHVYN